MPKKARTEVWRKKRRQEHLEMKKYRYYIFCEGQETEPHCKKKLDIVELLVSSI